jgi:hypothetical protein
MERPERLLQPQATEELHQGKFEISQEACLTILDIELMERKQISSDFGH